MSHHALRLTSISIRLILKDLSSAVLYKKCTCCFFILYSHSRVGPVSGTLVHVPQGPLSFGLSRWASSRLPTITSIFFSTPLVWRSSIFCWLLNFQAYCAIPLWFQFQFIVSIKKDWLIASFIVSPQEWQTDQTPGHTLFPHPFTVGALTISALHRMHHQL